MSTTMKVSLLALVSSVAAIPHYGHSKFHSKPTGIVGTGKPYPSGGWEGYNKTMIARPTGSYGEDQTIDTTTTSTKTIYSTVIVKPSPAPVSSNKAVVENVASKPVEGQCGPATVTVTAHEQVTVTVTPGAPASSAVAQSEGYKGEETTTSTVYSTTKVQETKTTKAPAPSSPVPAQSSKVEGYNVISSLVQKPVASSAAASSAAPKPTGSGNSYKGTKRGLAYNDASLCKSFGGKFGFGYNWGQVENNDIGTQFIPMMHGPDKATSDEWLANVDKAYKKGSRVFMGFNEPDHAEQANLTPEAACSAWKQYMNPIATKYSDAIILGPSVTNGGAESGKLMGLSWLTKFQQVCSDAVYHANNIHFYDIYDSGVVGRFTGHLEQAAQMGKPIWVTEYGLNPGSASQDQAATFLKATMSYMDGSDKVQGYSWFMVGDGENRLNSGTGLSELGKLYAAGM